MSNDDLMSELVTLRKEFKGLVKGIDELESYFDRVRCRLRDIIDGIGLGGLYDFEDGLKSIEERIVGLEDRLFIETLEKRNKAHLEGGMK